MIGSIAESVAEYLKSSPTMSYDSIFFLVFFGILLVLYWLMPVVTARQFVILCGNVFFYWFAGGIQLLAVIFVTSLIVYFSSVLMGGVYARFERVAKFMTPKESQKLLVKYKREARLHLLMSLTALLGLFLYIKIGKFLGFETVTKISDLSWKKIMVPLGLSYYTLSSVGYLLDIYNRRAKADDNYFTLLLCMTFFPTIVQGPISRYDTLKKQFNELPGFCYDNITKGMQLMLWGLFKKSVVADRLTIFASEAFGNIAALSPVETFFAILANVFSLYADFSGCMDIVIGAAEVLGVSLPANFEQPFFATSAAEFWRRWHITLGHWFRDYIYYPLTMGERARTQMTRLKARFKDNKERGKYASTIATTTGPLLLIWILTGLWHGTGLDYLTWGLYWGLLIVLSNIFNPVFTRLNKALRVDEKSFSHRVFQMCRTFVLFAFGRMLTVFGHPSGVLTVAKRLFAIPDPAELTNGTLLKYGLTKSDWNAVLLGLFLMWGAGMLREYLHGQKNEQNKKEKKTLRGEIARQSFLFRWPVYIAAIVLVMLLGTYGPGYNAAAFVYGNF